jgi:Lrp/AsnC family leucine-responsive transcriptional regulator
VSTPPKLDEVDWLLLEALQLDGRLSVRELARRVHLSPTATTHRLRRLEDGGVISGYRAVVDRSAIGDQVSAFIRLATRAKNFASTAAQYPEILECHRLAGADAYQIKVSVPSIGRLEALIDVLMTYGDPTTSIVLATGFADRPVLRPDASAAV